MGASPPQRGAPALSLAIEFHPAVRDELRDAYRWYEQRRIGLGIDFLDELERVLSGIAENPARHGFAEAGIHEGLLRRFPYAVYYRALSDRIRVLAVYHTSRDPSGWGSRQ
jgi:plasmid stabilization system protein ParE